MTMKKPKQKGETQKNADTDKKGSHKPDSSTVALLIVGSDNALHQDSPARRRALLYAACVSQYHVVVYGRGKPHQTAPLGTNGSVNSTSRSNIFQSFYEAYKKGCEVVNAHKEAQWVVSAQDPFESGLIAYAIARKTGAALHLQLHTDPEALAWKLSKKNRVRDIIYRFLAPRADAMRVVSERAKHSAIAHGATAERILVIPIVSDDEAVLSSGVDIRGAYKEAGEIILAMGRLSHEKGFDLLVEAMRDITVARPSALLLLVGSGPELDSLKRRVEWLGMAHAVRFIPWVRDVGAYLDAADVVVMPSRFEGWGLVACEAASHGKAVVMTDTGCAGEVIVNNESGVVVPPEDADALGEAIIRVLADSPFRKRLEKGAKVRASTLVTNSTVMELHKESWETAYRHGTNDQKKG